MNTTLYTNEDYIIKGTFSILENALGMHNMLQVSIGSSTTITVSPYVSTSGNDDGRIGFAGDNNERKWKITGKNTELGSNDKYYVYVKCSKTTNNAQLFISVYQYDVDGYRLVEGERNGESYDLNNYYISVGYINEPQSLKRQGVLDLGCYGTSKAEEKSIKQTIEDVVKSMISWFNGLFLKRDVNETTSGTIQAEGFITNEFKTISYTENSSGARMWQDENNGGHVETDYMTVRRSAYFRELTIAEVKHIGGEVVLSQAACTLSKAVYEEYTDTQTGKLVKFYRCYFDKEANEKKQYNEWRAGDLAYCKSFKNAGVGTQANVQDKYYWRRVLNVGETNDGYFINLGDNDEWKDVADGDAGIPEKNDNVVLLGHIGEDTTGRSTAQIYSTVGANAPSRIYYQGINSFSLSGKAVETMEWQSATDETGKSKGAHWRVGNDDNGYVDFSHEGLKIKTKSIVMQGTGKDVADVMDRSINVYMLKEEGKLPFPRENYSLTNPTENDYQFDWYSESASSEVLRSHENDLCVTYNGTVYRWEKSDLVDWRWRLVTDKYLIDAMNSINTISDTIGNITSDGKIIPSEKITIKSMREQMYAEHTEIKSIKDYLVANKPLTGKDDSWYEALGNDYATYHTLYTNLLQDFDEIIGSSEDVIDVPQNFNGHVTAYNSAVNSMRSRMNETNTSFFQQTDDMTKLGNTFFKKEGGVWVTKEGGLLTTSNSASLFAQYVRSDDATIAHKAEVTAEIVDAKEELGEEFEGKLDYAISKITLTADKIVLDATHKMKFTGETIEIDTDNFKLDNDKIVINTNNFNINENGDVDIKGVVRANVSYTTTTILTEATHTIDPQTEPCGCFMYQDVKKGTHLYLPLASEYDGLEIDVFVYAYDANYDSQLYHYICTQENAKLGRKERLHFKRDWRMVKVRNVNTSQDETYYLTKPYTSYTEDTDYARLITNEYYKFKAIGGAWVALTGRFTAE